MVDDTDPKVESDLRRRAAWLLVMLVVVAILFVVVMTTLLNGGGGSGGSNSGPGALDGAATSAVTSPSNSPRPSHTQHRSKPTATRSSTSPGTSSTPVSGTHCPTTQTCVLAGDVGNGIPAINAYRTQRGLPAVPGSASPQAQSCASNNGNGCSGGWAETELATPDGAEAVQKILPFAKLTDPQLKSIEVGWAYDPGAKLYYFAIIRND